jgi:SET domain
MDVAAYPVTNPSWFLERCRFVHPSVALRAGHAGGGGRGLFAVAEIRAGTILLVEQHLSIGASTRNLAARPTPAAYLRDLLFASCEQGAAALRLALTVLHPVALDCVPPDALARVEAECRPECEQLQREVIDALEREGSAAAGNLHRYVEAAAKERDCMMRLLLTMRFNAFHSGIYFALAMVNHSCRPNCTKFGQDTSRPKYPDCSELVAIRDIATDEELTISYLIPVEQAHCMRTEILQHQHFFDPEAPSAFPPACEATLGEMSVFARAAELRGIGEDIDDLEQSTKKRMRRRSFEDDLIDVEGRMNKILGPEHLLWTRYWRFVVRYCDVRLQRSSDSSERQRLILRQLAAARSVLGGMGRMWGPKTGSSHHELATMHDVCAQGIEYVLASGDRDFQAQMYKSVGVASFPSASKLESEHRREFSRISRLYASSTCPS